MQSTQHTELFYFSGKNFFVVVCYRILHSSKTYLESHPTGAGEGGCSPETSDVN